MFQQIIDESINDVTWPRPDSTTEKAIHRHKEAVESQLDEEGKKAFLMLREAYEALVGQQIDLGYRAGFANGMRFQGELDDFMREAAGE